MNRARQGRQGGQAHRIAAVLIIVGTVIAVLAGAAGTAQAASARPSADYAVLDVKASNLKDQGRLIELKVTYTCPRGEEVLVQAALAGLGFTYEGGSGIGGFGALDEEATCTGHRQHTRLSLPFPDALPGGRFVATRGVRAMGFLREIPTSDEVHEGGPFIQDIRG